jgi:hypothetical protein
MKNFKFRFCFIFLLGLTLIGLSLLDHQKILPGPQWLEFQDPQWFQLMTSELTLPSIYQWLPHLQANPEGLIPKIKLSKQR